jgi:hypothetical protein
MTAIFGIDADIAEEYLNRGFVCVDKTCEKERVALNTFRSIKTDDIIFIKLYSAVGLQVKAIGVVLSGHTDEIDAEVCIPVEWVWRGEKLIDELEEKCSRCADSLYQEHNIMVQREIIDLMPGELQLPNEW